jgi:hypothetical protein
VPVALGAFGGVGLLMRLALGPTVAALALALVVGGGLHAALLWRRRSDLDVPLRNGRSAPTGSR